MAAVWSSTKLLEFDYAGIEQVVMGWCFRSARYIRTAKLGTHAIVASHVLAEKWPGAWHRADLSKSDAEISAYLKTIKNTDDKEVYAFYDQSKRNVHGTAYGLTTYGMHRTFPKTFPSVKAAEAIQAVYFALAPEVPAFQNHVRHTAYLQRYLGGREQYTYLPTAPADRPRVIGHPYGYKHWFWSVVSYDRLSESQRLWREKRKLPVVDINGIWYGVGLGEDAKRTAAFYPQSIARGILTEACFPLFDIEEVGALNLYIGNLYYGDTPLRAPIHDSLLLECPTRKVDTLVERVSKAMMAPIVAMPCPLDWGMGPYLTVGVEAKIGDDWGAMKKLALPTPQELGVATDTTYFPAEEDEEEDVMDLVTKVSA